MDSGIYNMDCMEAMKGFEDNSVDSIVTDPPYGLSFMGKKWDYDVPKVEIWKECLRVLKPGGYLLSFAGTRTQHRMAVNIEDGGFEIRDMICWVYGSGFPKSLDISKGIDKMKGVEREIVGRKQHAKKDFKDNLYAQDPANANNNKVFGYGEETITAPATPEAQQWDGWGTALKPALEPITVARKPLSEKTVAANVLKWGTGGINVDGCRIGDNIIKTNAKEKGNSFTSVGNAQGFNGCDESYHQGRFPSNLIHDGSEEVKKIFPKSNSSDAIRKNKQSPLPPKDGWNNNNMVAQDSYGYNDSGSASRFFYTAKTSKEERNRGLNGFEEKYPAPAEFRPNHLKKAKEGEDGLPYGRWQPRANIHPTVKPVDLMRYLVRMVTPKGGICLDPFMGSGTTGIACDIEGAEFIGIEMDKDYFEIAKKRIEEETKHLKLF